MSTDSVSPPARTATPSPPELLAERIEAELARLREARPHLAERLDRASSILVAQLSCPPRTRPVRVRVAAGRRPRFLVASLSSPGAVYTVSPTDWQCSCPDAHRRGPGCKHALAAWILARVAREAQKGCAACTRGWVFLGEDVIDSETGEARTFHNPVRCRRCAGVQPPYLTDEELREWMASVRWRYARTMPKHPHEYSLKEWQDEERFERVVQTIWDQGYDRPYLRRPWRSLDVGEHYIWVCTLPAPRMPPPLEQTILINRAERHQERLV